MYNIFKEFREWRLLVSKVDSTQGKVVMNTAKFMAINCGT